MLESSMVDACRALVPDAAYIEKIGRNIVRTHWFVTNFSRLIPNASN